MQMTEKIRVGIVGATGYSGQELIRLLLSHPGVELTYLAATSDAGETADLLPQVTGTVLPSIVGYRQEDCVRACEVAFVALPSGAAGRIAGELWGGGLKVIDLSGDLRLNAEAYREWYGKSPAPKRYLDSAVYGLSEWNREEISQATLVSNPGCYATAILLGLLPLAKAGLLQGQLVTVDAKSGVSGAGRSPKFENQLAQLADNFVPYKIGQHQHTPEVEQQLGNGTKLLLTTQLLPITRGIYACAYVRWPELASIASVREIYQAAYGDEPYVHLLPEGVVPQLKSVRGSNSCHLQVHLDERTHTLMVFSALDNLVKGAAGQAVQNLNLMYAFPPTAGLSPFGFAP
ncbi:N-acetyl-gamma-glutamyl-phosphate reductase [Alicyclobacillus ferrooxydans]|nr:N-acetyl-gamma-glutamyl-phosphate reductase [Alicyclobacillus ferrooxydans]